MNAQSSPFRKTILEIALFVLAAFAVRAWWATQVHIVDYDGMYFISAARQIAHGEALRSDPLVVNSHGGSPTFPPFYAALLPFLMAKLSVFTPDLEKIGQLVSTTSGALTLVPIWLLARSALGLRTARLAAALAVFYPPMVELSGEVLIESTYACLYAFAAFAWWRAHRSGRTWDWVISGLALGAATFARLECLLSFILLESLGVWVNWKRGAARAALLALVMALGFLAIMGPYKLYLNDRWKDRKLDPYFSMRQGVEVYYNSRDLQDFIEALWRLTPDGKEFAIYDDEARWGYLDFLKRNHKKILAAYPWNLKREWDILHLYFAFPFVAAAAVYGLWGIGKRKPDAKGLGLLFVAASGSLFQYAALPWWPHHPVETRYMFYIFPLVLIGAAEGLLRALERKWPGTARPDGSLTPFGKSLLAIGLGSYVCWAVPYFPNMLNRDEPMEFKKMAGWIEKNLPEKAVVMSTHPWDVFYSDRRWVCAPYAPLEKILAFGKLKRAEYLSVTERYGAARPMLEGLLDPSRPHPGLKFLHMESLGGKSRIALYRIE